MPQISVCVVDANSLFPNVNLVSSSVSLPLPEFKQGFPRNGSLWSSIASVKVCVCDGFQRACQTRRVHTAEAEVQTLSTAETGSQTEPQNPAAEQHLLKPEELDPEGLKDFLGRVEDTVIRQLVRNSRSHAFDGFRVNWKDPSNLVRRTDETSSCWNRSESAGSTSGGGVSDMEASVRRSRAATAFSILEVWRGTFT